MIIQRAFALDVIAILVHRTALSVLVFALPVAGRAQTSELGQTVRWLSTNAPTLASYNDPDGTISRTVGVSVDNCVLTWRGRGRHPGGTGWAWTMSIPMVKVASVSSDSADFQDGFGVRVTTIGNDVIRVFPPAANGDYYAVGVASQQAANEIVAALRHLAKVCGSSEFNSRPTTSTQLAPEYAPSQQYPHGQQYTAPAPRHTAAAPILLHHYAHAYWAHGVETPGVFCSANGRIIISVDENLAEARISGSSVSLNNVNGYLNIAPGCYNLYVYPKHTPMYIMLSAGVDYYQNPY
jgi:hypothetical protein